MKKMATAWRLGDLTVKNRIVRSATVEGLSTEDGKPTPRLVQVTADLARGGVGLIVLGTAYVSLDARADTGTTGLHTDAVVAPLSEVTRAVHKEGGLVAAQLLHCGSTINPAILPEKKALYGPSSCIDPLHGQKVSALSKREIRSIVENYRDAALRAKKAGFDAVQVHAAHGYLLNQFLSPATNRREDEYGGTVENRGRFLLEVCEAIRKAAGSGYPLFIKLSGYDGFQGGLESQDAAAVAALLDKKGLIDAVEVSAGTPEGAKKGGWDHILPAPFEEGSLLKYALPIKENVSCPVISVEGWRTPEMIEKALEKVDAVSMSRPFIREPHLTERWLQGDDGAAACISCNRCLDLIATTGLGCVFCQEKEGGIKQGVM